MTRGHEPRVAGEVGGAPRDELRSFVGCSREGSDSDRVSPAHARHGIETALELIRPADRGQDRALGGAG